MSFLQFNEIIIRAMEVVTASETCNDDSPSPKRVRLGRHSEVPLTQRLNGADHLVDVADVARDCKVCSSRMNGKRKRAKCICTGCLDQPHYV